MMTFSPQLMKNGDSGWAWNEFRRPPKFHNDAGYNVLHLDRLADPKADPDKFEQQMMSFCKGTLVPTIQKAGWVFDPASKRTVPLAVWLEQESSRAKVQETPNLPKKQEQEQEQEQEQGQQETWSVVTLGESHNYATEVETFDSKSKAEQEAKDLGNCYVVKGTQMWNEPLGQVEEHDRTAPYKFFSGR